MVRDLIRTGRFVASMKLALVVSGLSLGAAAAQAAFVSPTSWTRGGGGTTYQGWDVFTDDNGSSPLVVDSTPDLPGFINPHGSPTLTETTGSAFLTSGGNIYAPATATAFSVGIPEADVPTPPHNVTAIVQLRTLGSELDYANIRLNGLAAVDSAELLRETISGGFGGTTVEHWALFQVPYANFTEGTAGVSHLTLTFNAASSSMSLDRLSIDTAISPLGFFNEPNPVPEPAFLTLLSLAAALVGTRHPRR